MMPRLGHQKPLTNPDWQLEEVRYEINRLKDVLLDPNSTAEERSIAQSQLDDYQQASETGKTPKVPKSHEG